jgi:NADH dehydrogenase
VFAIGDMISLNKLPGVAQPALQEGRYVGKVIKKRLAGETNIKPFHYFDKGNMATIGYRSAVADAFHVRVTGLIAYLMWGLVHVWYLIGWGNRIGTIYQWLRALVFTKNRNHRIITYSRAKKDINTGRIYKTGRLSAILPAVSRPDDLNRPLAVPTRPASETRSGA